MSYTNIPTSKLNDEELSRLPILELIDRLRRCDQERIKIKKDYNHVAKEVNPKLQECLSELRSLKEANTRLQEDNLELRDLCCFLDDERNKGRKLAKEWQKFGRYTSNVMGGEVGDYRDKLKDLEGRQEELMTENLDLKRLVLYIEEERRELCGDRDAGDGSSNSSNTDNMEKPSPTMPGVPLLGSSSQAHRQTDTLQYVKQLEERIQRLEEEKKSMAPNGNDYDNYGKPSIELSRTSSRTRVMSPSRADTYKYFSSPNSSMPAEANANKMPPRPQSAMGALSPGRTNNWVRGPSPDPQLGQGQAQRSPKSRPEAVGHAMKVLEIHEQLEAAHRDMYQQDDLDDTHKALVRQMCNVVWKKLGDEVPSYKTQV